MAHTHGCLAPRRKHRGLAPQRWWQFFHHPSDREFATLRKRLMFALSSTGRNISRSWETPLQKPYLTYLIVTQWRVVAWLFEHCDNFSKLTPHFAWCSKAQDEYNCCCHQEKWVAGCWVVGEQFRELCCGTGLAKRLKAGHCWWGGLHHCRHRPPPDLVNVSTLMMKASRKWP